MRYIQKISEISNFSVECEKQKLYANFILVEQTSLWLFLDTATCKSFLFYLNRISLKRINQAQGKKWGCLRLLVSSAHGARPSLWSIRYPFI